MRIVAIDIGNTKIAAGVVEASRVVHRFGGTLGPRSGMEARVAEVFDWMRASVNQPGIRGVVVASVVPSALVLLERLWETVIVDEVASVIVDHRSPLPYLLEVERPETVGADRLCNVAGACALGHHDAIVVDLGTANTFDLLRDGVFVGGLIAPGAERAHRALVESGAQLPDIPFAYPRDLVGRNTVDAITAGSFYQAVGGVAFVIERLRIDRPSRPVILAGGLGEMIGPELGFEVVYVPDLTLIGAAEIGCEVWDVRP